jgi:hypothetical protein
MPRNNWEEKANGETYVQRIGAEGRSDVLDWARDFLAPRVQRVFDDFSERYDWGDAVSLKFSNRAGTSGREGGRGVPDSQVLSEQSQAEGRIAGQDAQEGRLDRLPGAPNVPGFYGHVRSGLPNGEVRAFASIGDMPTNNWKENSNGESYLQRIGAEGRSDVLDWARDFLAPRFQFVFNDISGKNNS